MVRWLGSGWAWEFFFIPLNNNKKKIDFTPYILDKMFYNLLHCEQKLQRVESLSINVNQLVN